MNYGTYRLGHAPVIICLYHVDIDASMIQQRIGVDIVRDRLKRNHVLVDQILNLVFEVDTILSIMSNAVGVITHLWSGL